MRGATPADLGLDVLGLFQSAPLMRGATFLGRRADRRGRVSIRAPHARGDHRRHPGSAGQVVSIRAPHARGDRRRRCQGRRSSCFNPRPSCEGRPSARLANVCDESFQSAPLMRGATIDRVALFVLAGVSIRAPHARGDAARLLPQPAPSCFNPRPSCEGRLRRRRPPQRDAPVSIRAPHARGDDDW